MPRRERSEEDQRRDRFQRAGMPTMPEEARIPVVCEVAGCEAWSEVAVLSRGRNRYVGLCGTHYDSCGGKALPFRGGMKAVLPRRGSGLKPSRMCHNVSREGRVALNSALPRPFEDALLRHRTVSSSLASTPPSSGSEGRTVDPACFGLCSEWSEGSRRGRSVRDRQHGSGLLPATIGRTGALIPPKEQRCGTGGDSRTPQALAVGVGQRRLRAEDAVYPRTLPSHKEARECAPSGVSASNGAGATGEPCREGTR